MFSKILNKLKLILGKKSVADSKKSKKVAISKKTTNSSKSSKTVKASKGKKKEEKVLCESFTKIPGVGIKSAKAFYAAGFKSTDAIIAANDEELLAVPGVGINLVKKLRKYKPN